MLNFFLVSVQQRNERGSNGDPWDAVDGKRVTQTIMECHVL